MSAECDAQANAAIENAPPFSDSGELNQVEGVYEIESLCMNCHEDGVTRISVIHIPFFKQVLLESFSCEHCGHKNTTVKSAGEIQEKGSKYTFRIENEDDFQRTIVRGETAVFRIEDLDLEAPAGPGQLTNLESMLSKILLDLEADQPQRKKGNAALHDALDAIIQKLIKMLNGGSFPITVSLEDPSGNSFIEPSPDDRDSKYVRTDFLRSHQQNIALGLAIDDDDDDDDEDKNGDTGEDKGTDAMEGVDIVDGQIYEIPAECPACAKACTVNMKKVQIPHFKEVIIMATVCEHCGYRTSDVKTGGAIPEKGQRITLQVDRREDLSRDILKSETCVLQSPQLDLEVQPGTLGGRFTTVEGLLTQVRDQLYGQIFDLGDEDEGLIGGDSMPATMKEKWDGFFNKLDCAIKGDMKFSVVLNDPLASSYVGPCSTDVDEDPQIVKEDYERTAEEMEDLGLNDMKTEGYENNADSDNPTTATES